MIRREKICYAIIALVLTVITGCLINKLCSNGMLLLVSSLIFFLLFFVLSEAFYNTIKKIQIKENIIMTIVAISAITCLVTLIIAKTDAVVNRNIIATICIISFVIFLFLGAYNVGIEKRK